MLSLMLLIISHYSVFLFFIWCGQQTNIFIAQGNVCLYCACDNKTFESLNSTIKLQTKGVAGASSRTEGAKLYTGPFIALSRGALGPGASYLQASQSTPLSYLKRKHVQALRQSNG